MMRIIITLAFFIGILTNCGISMREELNGNNTVLAQTNTNSLQNSKDKQRNKLYPYYLDYPIDLSLDGVKLDPVLKALDSFKKDKEIPETKKNLDKYNLELRQDDKFFFVTLTVKRDPNKIYVGGETENGVDVSYLISKQDGSINRAFQK